MLVEPQERLSIAAGSPAKVEPSSTPSAIARKIHKVRKRSRNERRSRFGCVIDRLHRRQRDCRRRQLRSEEHTSELQSLMRISYAVFCLKKKKTIKKKMK